MVDHFHSNQLKHRNKSHHPFFTDLFNSLNSFLCFNLYNHRKIYDITHMLFRQSDNRVQPRSCNLNPIILSNSHDITNINSYQGLYKFHIICDIFHNLINNFHRILFHCKYKPLNLNLIYLRNIHYKGLVQNQYRFYTLNHIYHK
jgi:hypothetical protein